MHIAMNSIHSTQLDLNLLKTFDALFVTRSASRAAEALGVGQPAVSHALGRLRNAIGDPLFIRTAGRMEPTARAQRLAEPVREALMAAGRALAIEESFDPAQRPPDLLGQRLGLAAAGVVLSRALRPGGGWHAAGAAPAQLERG
jgi:DNA-binding transcriptional LysR family regulator